MRKIITIIFLIFIMSVLVACDDGHVNKLYDAFDNDGYTFDKVKDVYRITNKDNDSKLGTLGIIATNKTAKTGSSEKIKKVYYVEGNPYERGYLLGLMAKPEIQKMATTFKQNIVFQFFNLDINKNIEKIIGNLISDIVYYLAKHDNITQDIPQVFKDEIRGIVDACNDKEITIENISAINYGIDILLSIIYSDKLPIDLLTNDLKTALGKFVNIEEGSTEINLDQIYFQEDGKTINLKDKIEIKLFKNTTIIDTYFLGINSIFPNLSVFKDATTLIIYKPREDNAYLNISMTVPGLVGSITGLNEHGIAGGLNMTHNENSNPHRQGLNSFIMVRNFIQYSKDIDEAKNKVIDGQRGGAWDFIIGDENKSYFIEAGATVKPSNYILTFVPDNLTDIKPPIKNQKKIIAFLSPDTSKDFKLPNYFNPKGLSLNKGEWIKLTLPEYVNTVHDNFVDSNPNCYFNKQKIMDLWNKLCNAHMGS